MANSSSKKVSFRGEEKVNNKALLSFVLVFFLFHSSVRASEPIQMHISAAENDTNAIARLIGNGTDVNRIENNQACTPLHWAARCNRREAAEFLIEHGADVNARDYTGMTPLHYAALCGHCEMVEMLLNKKAQVNAFDCQGLTPLHLAAQYGHVKAVEVLLTYGADLSAKTSYCGLTPLHWAAYWRHIEVINVLLKNGADINARDHNGRTPLTWAEQNNNYDVARLLARKGGKRNPCDKAPLYSFFDPE